MLRNKLKLSYYSITIFLGACVSLAWIYLVPTQPFSDFAYYRSVAQEIANGRAWGSTYTTIGYSIFLAGVYIIFGDTLLIAKFVNVIFYTISNILFWGILNKSDMQERLKKIVFGAFVFFPANIFYNSILANETMFTCFLLACIRLYLSDVKLKYFWMGIITGINILIKQQFIVFSLVIFIVDQINERSFLKNARNGLVILSVACFVISPMVYYNSKMMGQFTGVANNGGIVLYINNNSQNQDGRWMLPEDIENSVVLKSEYINANRTKQNAMLRKVTVEWIVDHPIQFITLGLLRIKNTFMIGDDIFYTLNGIPINEKASDILVIANSAVKSIFFIPTIFMTIIQAGRFLRAFMQKETWSSSRFDLMAAAVFNMFVIIYFISEGQGRYSYPVTFCIVYFTCQAGYSLLFKVKTLTSLKIWIEARLDLVVK
jgi:hypothetical protein